MGLVAQTPDSATRARYAPVLAALDDSLTALDAATAGFQSDLATASPDLVVSRSERLRRRCVGVERASEPLVALLSAKSAPRRELDALRAAVARCKSDFVVRGNQTADSLKAWAPYRLGRLGEAVRRYRLSAQALNREMGIKR